MAPATTTTATTTATTTTASSTATVIPFPGTTAMTAPRRHRVRGLVNRIKRREVPRRQPKRQRPYQRRVDVERFSYATGDWQRMLMTMQRLT